MSLADIEANPPLAYTPNGKGLTNIMNGAVNMTLLQHYAGLAMQGLVSCPYWVERRSLSEAPRDAAIAAVFAAKCLIAELEKEAP